MSVTFWEAAVISYLPTQDELMQEAGLIITSLGTQTEPETKAIDEKGEEITFREWWPTVSLEKKLSLAASVRKKFANSL